MADESDTVNPDSTPITTTPKEQVLSNQDATVEATNGKVLVGGENIPLPAKIQCQEVELKYCDIRNLSKA